MAKSRFMVVLDCGGIDQEMINCEANTTEGVLKETKDLIPDGIEFMVVQVKRENLMYEQESKRVLKGAEDDKETSGKECGKEETSKEDSGKITAGERKEGLIYTSTDD